MSFRGACARACIALVLAFAGLASEGRARQSGDLGALQSGLSDPELLAELRRASFTSSSDDRALARLEDLDAEGGSSESLSLQRAAALFSLGTGGSGAHQVRLEETARFGTTLDRFASLLGLAFLPDPPLDFLSLQLGADTPVLRDAAALGLLLVDPAQANPVLADNGTPGELRRWKELAQFLERPDSAPMPGAGRAWAILQVEAARRFGLVDGRSWRSLRADVLSADTDYLDAVLLPHLAQLNRLEARDHLLSWMLRDPNPRLAAAALVAMPEQVNALITHNLWRPADPASWEAMAAELRGPYDLLKIPAWVQRALAQEVLVEPVAAMMLGAQLMEAWELLEPLSRDPDPAVRARFAQRLAESGDPQWLGELERLDNDESTAVRAAALVARVRLGGPEARARIALGLEGLDDVWRSALTEALAKFGGQEALLGLLEEALVRAAPEQELRIALAAARGGSVLARALLASRLRLGTAGELAPDCIRALTEDASAEERLLFGELFPTDGDHPGDRELDIELGRALIELEEPEGLRLVRGALWDGPFERGVLVGYLLAELEGVFAIEDELASPPVGARPSDMRRIGFVLGEWGGLATVERLARRRQSSDPVLQGAYLGALGGRTR
ncbi:MAG: HEAT repeat domain-containing protein [Planctomycetota bacterium]